MAGGGTKSNKHRKVGRTRRSPAQAKYKANSQDKVNKARKIIQMTRKSGGKYKNSKELAKCGVLAIRAACRTIGIPEEFQEWAKNATS